MSDIEQQMLFSDTPPLGEVLKSESYALLRNDAEKLQARLEGTDSEGIVTSARTLLETCCKHILGQLAISYSTKEDLPQLHKKVANALELHQDQHADEQLKQMIRGGNMVVNSLASLRNSHSDAHGKKIGHLPLNHTQAEYAAYMACALTRFLVHSFEHQVTRKTHLDLSDPEKEMLLTAWREIASKSGVTDPDQVIFKPAFEEIALKFTELSTVVLSRESIYKFLTNARKTKGLWTSEISP